MRIVCIPVAPKLAPIAFPAGTHAGMHAQVTCLVRAGDQPITVVWKKDGEPLKPQLDIQTSQLNEFTSVLMIANAQDEHTGNYTCLASNSARTTATTAMLSVTGMDMRHWLISMSPK